MNRQERILSLALLYKMSDDTLLSMSDDTLLSMSDDTLLSMYKDLTAYRKDYPKGDSRIDHFIMIIEDEIRAKIKRRVEQNRLEINSND
jgi:hypothetical protein